MSFSFIGYVHIAPIFLTFVYIPVMVAGCILGPKNATIVGAVFGIASMWKASAFYVAAGDAIFSPVMSEKPFASILLSVGSRALFGLIIGLLYRVAKNSRHPIAGILLVSTVGRTIHTVLVYSFMQLLFPEAGFTLINTLDDIRRWDFLPFIVIVDAIVVICYLTSRSEFVRGVLERVRNVDQVNELSSRSRIGMAVMLSLALLAIIFILMYQKNFNYLYYEARLDGLTGLMGRQQFFQAGKKILGEMKFEREDVAGCFVILDVDSFKEINDRYGHPEGDRVLREVADHLRKAVGGVGHPRTSGRRRVCGADPRSADRGGDRNLHESAARGLCDHPGRRAVCDLQYRCDSAGTGSVYRGSVPERGSSALRGEEERKKSGGARLPLS